MLVAAAEVPRGHRGATTSARSRRTCPSGACFKVMPKLWEVVRSPPARPAQPSSAERSVRWPPFKIPLSICRVDSLARALRRRRAPRQNFRSLAARRRARHGSRFSTPRADFALGSRVRPSSASTALMYGLRPREARSEAASDRAAPSRRHHDAHEKQPVRGEPPPRKLLRARSPSVGGRGPRALTGGPERPNDGRAALACLVARSRQARPKSRSPQQLLLHRARLEQRTSGPRTTFPRHTKTSSFASNHASHLRHGAPSGPLHATPRS